ncbi:MAG: phage tail tape measure protein, partial [Papillibacter sp.]|nr:phage tail tape measure protein [Papillibacter sp.]
MADRREYEMLFKLNAQLGGSYNSTFRSAQESISKMEKEITSLSKTQADIKGYQAQQSAVESTSKRLDILRQQYDNIQQEMRETGDNSANLKNELLKKQLQIDKTSASLEKQEEKLRRTGAALKEAGIDTSNLTTESSRLEAQIADLKNEQEKAAESADNFGSTTTDAIDSISTAFTAAGLIKLFKETADVIKECAEASIEFESAMTGVAKTTDLSDAELAALSDELKSLATVIPVATTELASIGEVAGQLGIAKEDLLSFTTVMSQLSTATTMTADEAATMLAQLANITQMDPSYYSNLASAIVDLGNTFATTEQKITDMAQGIAA